MTGALNRSSTLSASTPCSRKCRNSSTAATSRDFENATGIYIAEAPIAILFPHLLQYIRIPEYFAHCFSRRAEIPPLPLATPSLSLASQGTFAPATTSDTHQWIYLAQGEKHWVTACSGAVLFSVQYFLGRFPHEHERVREPVALYFAASPRSKSLPRR